MGVWKKHLKMASLLLDYLSILLGSMRNTVNTVPTSNDPLVDNTYWNDGYENDDNHVNDC